MVIYFRSLVTTNEHLLQEINQHKQPPKPISRYNANDINMYSPSMQDSYGLPVLIQNGNNQNNQINGKSVIRKQIEQLNNLNNSVNSRFSYSVVK